MRATKRALGSEKNNCVQPSRLAAMAKRILAVSSGALLLWGCSDPAAGDGGVREAEAPLTGTATITLKTPYSVPVLTPTIGALNSLSLGAGSEVVSGPITALGATGGGIHTEPDAIMNETWTRGTADLRDRTNVRGTLHAANRSLGNNVTITKWDSAPVLDPVKQLTWTVKYPSSTTGAPVTVNSTESKSIGAGQYGVVTVSSGGTLTLGPGTYYLKSLVLESTSVLKLNQAAGPIIIYIDTTFAFRGTVTPLVGTGAPDWLVVYLGTAGFSLETLFNGAIVAPSATLTLRAVSGIHTGYFFAKDVQNLDAHTRIQYRAPLPLIPAANPPDNISCAALVQALSTPATLQANLARYCKSCPTDDDTDRDKVPDCFDGCPYDALKTAPGLRGCGVPDTDDGDGDRVSTPIDLCPDDPRNTSPGQCGCVTSQPGLPGPKPAGTPCTDTACPQANAVCDGAGVCGNPSSCSPEQGCKPVEWHSSTYWVCLPPGGGNTGTGGTSGTGGTGGTGGTSGSGGTAGSGGSSGNTNLPGSTEVPQGTAQQRCAAKGQTLLRIDNAAENRFITSLVSSFIRGPIWIGANDITTLNTWRWSAPGTNNGDQFWSGAATGTPVSNRYANWAPGAPGTQRCAMLMPDQGGRWVDAACTAAAGYICEYKVPYVDQPTSTGGDLKPPGRFGFPFPPMTASSCKPSESAAGLPDNYDTLRADIDASYAGVNQGAGATPPPLDAGPCDENPLAQNINFDGNPDAGCIPTTVLPGECLKDEDCAAAGPGFICRQYKEDPACAPTNAGVPTPGAQCLGHARCMQISCPTAAAPCDQRDICEPGTEVTAVKDPTSDLDKRPVTSAGLFDGGVPDAAPTTEFYDPAIPGGPAHTWCTMNPQDQNSVKPASATPQPAYAGRSGSGSTLQFNFDPNLIFEAKADVLALGETQLKLHAQAGLSTTVTLDKFIGQTFTTGIFEASVGVRADRCSISDKQDTKFTIFGLDALSALGIGIPEFDTNDPASPLHSFSKACQDSIGQYILYADRAKKAFRDAQQMVSQFNAAKAAGSLLSGDLCNQLKVAAATVPFFPGGNDCPANEPAYVTINRFVDYYQAPGFGQIAKLKDAQSALGSATAALKGAIRPSFPFGGEPHEESQTIVNVTFLIGPVPVLLQIDVFAQYGVGGAFEITYDLPSLLTEPPTVTPRPLAKADARVVPFAAAGLSAFVGVGFDLGPLKASIGIEGMITLAEISAPIFAGVGLDALAQPDTRPMPSDVLTAALSPSSLHFPDPKAFKFFVSYEYGAGIDVNNVLAGEINGRLRIKFFFFSRTWRKRVVKFNGWGQHFDLISGGSDPAVTVSKETAEAKLNTGTGDGGADTAGISTDVASGTPSMGLSETQVPLAVLQRVSPPDVLPDGGTVDFDGGQLEGAFYDDLCCSKVSQLCSPNGRPGCCPGLNCVTPEVDAGELALSFCEAPCHPIGSSCDTVADCCGWTETVHGPVKCDSETHLCATCQGTGAPCADNGDCCPNQFLACNTETHTCERPGPR